MSIQAIFKFRGTAISNFQESFIESGIGGKANKWC